MKASRQVTRRDQAVVPTDFPETLHPILAQVYAARQVRGQDELTLSLACLAPYNQLLGIDAAVELLYQALTQQQRILIVGDFDADGATSTAVACRALGMMGARHVDFLVPNRFEYGYGLTPEIVEVARERKPDLLVTVDNGISSISGVAAARAAGMRVLVTDHHLPAEQLPVADAIINPNQPGDRFPYKSMAGVGVIFYVMLALRARLRAEGWFEQQAVAEPNLAQLLDLVALGTVADVVPLEYNNRILVAQGLARIRAGEACHGIQALLEVSTRQAERIVAADMGFAVGPRLNAAGRLDDMSLGIRCLLSDNLHEARRLAAQLDELNKERRSIEASMQEEAIIELQKFFSTSQEDWPSSLCLYRPDWHEGVIGILASRIKERIHRPVIIFTDSNDEQIKGSARSIPGLHIRDTLDAVAAHHPGLLSKFGGHAMAAGMTLPRENFAIFRQAFANEVERQLQAETLQATLLSDGGLRPDDLNHDLAEQLRFGGPWGQAFPEPLFDNIFSVVSSRIVGEKHLKLVLRWPQSNQVIDAIQFNADLEQWHDGIEKIFTVYRVDLNEFRGQRSVQLMIEHLEPRT